MLSNGLSDFSGVSLSDRPGNWSSQASWRRKQSEHKVVGHCGTVFDSLQNIPEKSELQSHIFKLEKAVQQIYTLRAEGNAKVFQTCSQVVSELETACTLFELELPKHISELRGLGEALAHHSENSRIRYFWRLTQLLPGSPHRRIQVSMLGTASLRKRTLSTWRSESCVGRFTDTHYSPSAIVCPTGVYGVPGRGDANSKSTAAEAGGP